MLEKVRDTFVQVNRAFQFGLAALFAVMGVMLALTFVLNPSWVFAGDKPLEGCIQLAGALGLCWLQWRYRHIVYPQLRRDYLAAQRGPAVRL